MPMSVGTDETKRLKRETLKSNQMTNSKQVSSKTHEAVVKFHDWLQKVNNVHTADLHRMDRAYNIVRENIEQMHTSRKPTNTMVNKY